MADNTLLNSGTGGDTIRDKDRTGVKTQIVALDLNPAGAETLMSGAMPVTDNSGSITVDAPVGTPVFVRLSDGSAAIATLPVSIAATVTVSGTVTANAGSGTLTTKETRSATGTSSQPSIATTAGGTTVLASNANRLGASVRNDGSNDVFMLLGTGTVTSSVYTTKMSPGAYFEVPFGYTGIITGIAVTAAVTLRVTEYT